MSMGLKMLALNRARGQGAQNEMQGQNQMRNQNEMRGGGGQMQNEMRGGMEMRNGMEMNRMGNEMRGGYGGMESNQGGQMRNEMGMGYGNMEMNRMEMRDNPNMRGYDRDRRGRFTGEMEMNRTYEYGPKNGMEMENGMESRFRDNRRQEYRGDMNSRGEMGSRWLPPYFEESEMEQYGRNEMEAESNQARNGMEMEQRNPVGFAAHFDSPGKSDASYQGMKEGEHMKGPSMKRGGAMSQSVPKFNKHMAEEWTAKMENEDGSKGPHWSMDQVKQIMQQKKVEADEAEFFAILNAVYSDFSAVAQKHGVHKQDFYLDMAKAWLKDKDAVKDKASAYYMYIVKH